MMMMSSLLYKQCDNKTADSSVVGGQSKINHLLP